ncbi:DUF305 domain-containing protein [Aminobacter aganoensis]|uniref:DUF305 domain-containing protein n=1 Tax=Aminobacter aganoensis TaxID=83264 RepID=A0A7X0F872_9HYPH|nr:DUF305 domain-containing protein [Aminobacter aganoensis]MBB6354872.1 hypothetical protein [Aminobacter aganoensis]
MNIQHHSMHNYLRLLAMAVLSFIAMFALMYAMVNTFADVFANLNQFYMAALMVFPMILIELLLMRAMYPNRAINVAIVVFSLVAFTASWFMIREQTAIADVQFLKSMIPHHSGAVLMCENATVSDPEIAALCSDIVPGQQAEIDKMREILQRLEGA